MGPECTAYHQNLADKIANNSGEQYSKVQYFIRSKLSFIIIRSAMLCLRGSRTIRTQILPPLMTTSI